MLSAIGWDGQLAKWGDGMSLLGRICLGAIFVWGGFGKATAAAATIAYFTKLGVPVPTLAYGTAVSVELFGGALFMAGLFYRPMALILGLWCIATALLAHSDFSDHDMVIHFYKNIAMFGGFLQALVLGAGYLSADTLLRRRIQGSPATR